MRLRRIYELAVREGMKADPRGEMRANEDLENAKRRLDSLSAAERERFDRETLKNPYDDTRILHGSPDTEIKTAFVGIDVDTSELLLIDRINASKKNKIDLAVSHHPQGIAFAAFYEVMDMQADIFLNLGVPINISEKLVEERKKEVSRRLHAANHHRASDAARLLGIPFLSIHTPADNHAVSFLEKTINQRRPKVLKDVLAAIDDIDEYKIARRECVPPTILFGSPESRTGKIFIDMTGGTEGPREIVDNLLQAGIGTVIGMHLSEDHYKKYQGKNINVVIAGHIASDNLGMNLLLDKIEKTSPLKIVPGAGFRRIRRS